MARLANQMKQLYAMCATALVMGRADLDGADDVGFDIELPIFTVGQTAELANIHPQTLRQYDRLGLVRPQRTDGGARRYCLRDIACLTRAQRLSQDEGINLSGIARILVLEEENRQLRREVKRMQTGDQESVFAAGRDGNIVEVQRPTAPASGATPSAAKPANCPAAILPPISLPAPPATPTTLPPTPSPWSCGVGESGRIASIPSPFVKLFVISHRAAAESTNLLDGDVKVCYGDVRKPIRKGCFRLRRYVPNPSNL